MNWTTQKISAFQSISAPPKLITLGEWLEYCCNETQYSTTIEQYRKTKDKSFKRSLPLATPGAIMEGGRKRENISKRTGWIAIDIDSKSNPDIQNWEEFRDSLQRVVYIAYAGLSVSASGVWGLIKVSQPDMQAEHFKQLIHDFRSIRINLDTSKGCNPHDARFLSYDPNCYIASDVEIYDRLPIRKVSFAQKKHTQSKQKALTRSFTGNNSDEVNKCLEWIASNKINLAPDYGDYLRIGFALAEEFGEAGRGYFHQAVCHSHKYNKAEADRQYTHCINYNRHQITIRTFFHYCNQHKH